MTRWSVAFHGGDLDGFARQFPICGEHVTHVLRADPSCSLDRRSVGTYALSSNGPLCQRCNWCVRSFYCAPRRFLVRLPWSPWCSFSAYSLGLPVFFLVLFPRLLGVFNSPVWRNLRRIQTRAASKV